LKSAACSAENWCVATEPAVAPRKPCGGGFGINGLGVDGGRGDIMLAATRQHSGAATYSRKKDRRASRRNRPGQRPEQRAATKSDNRFLALQIAPAKPASGARSVHTNVARGDVCPPTRSRGASAPRRAFQCFCVYTRRQAISIGDSLAPL
jgi:hypothetical protein